MMEEDRVVRLIQRRFAAAAPMLRLGIGDDAAVIRPRGAAELWTITTDLLIEEVDFRRAWSTPEQLGHRALAVNLSDIAAMGCRPRFYTVGLALPRDCKRGWILQFYRGMTALGRRHGAELIGGDLSRSPRGIYLSVTVLGCSVGRKLLLRSAGRPGDLLYVTGTLGQAAAGLALLERGRRRGAAARRAVEAHLRPEPRCETGLWLCRRGRASAAIDLSDGLSSDLPRLCRASGVGAEIEEAALPLFRASARWRMDPLELGLHGGDDYELLFAVPPGAAGRLERDYPADLPPVTRIGRLTARRQILLTGAATSPLEPRGYDHFAPRR
jgi:thiamine-monophosphate kinase